MNTREYVLSIINGLSADELDRWVKEGWVAPQQEQEHLVFTEVDIARLHLIVEFSRDLEIEEASIPIVLSLLDQLNSTRRDLRLLASAIGQQPSSVRTEIMATVTDDISKLS